MVAEVLEATTISFHAAVLFNQTFSRETMGIEALFFIPWLKPKGKKLL